MDNKKTDNYYIKKVLENIDAIIVYTKGLKFDDFVSDNLIVDATSDRNNKIEKLI